MSNSSKFDSSREQRLAEALRVNLKRRKASERTKAAAVATQQPEPEDKP